MNAGRQNSTTAPRRDGAKEGSFNPQMLRTARGALALTQTELASRVGLRQSAISRWEDGIREPARSDVETLAEVLLRPIEFFYLPDRLYGVDSAFMYHRKRQRLPIGKLNQIHDRINIVRLGIARLVGNVDEWPVRFEHMDVEDERYTGPTQIAQFVRAMWQVPYGPIPDLIALVESAGAIVVPMDFGTDQFDAVGQWPPGLPPLFFLNLSAPADRMRFSLAHEIGHIIMHRIPTPSLESEADAFASEFLMPARHAESELSNLTLREAMRLKLRWRISAQAIIRRAKDVGMISDRRYKSLCVEVSRRGFRKREPNPIQPEKPSTLQRLANVHLDLIGYTHDELCQLTYCTDSEFREIYLDDDFGEASPTNLRVVW